MIQQDQIPLELEDASAKRTKPRLWVKELAVYKDFKPDAEMRHISLRPGLNIIWAKDSQSGASGHAAGKSTFCRMLRYLVGDVSYPLSSLRERIYAPDGKGAMEGRYGILIYTSSSGAEGTLGGLVQSARNIRKHLLKAAQAGTLCSNDPVCSSDGAKHGGIDKISGSACHGCLYIAETSCERFNQFLDRSLVVPTIDRRGCELLKI